MFKRNNFKFFFLFTNFDCLYTIFFFILLFFHWIDSKQKVVLKVLTMTDDKTKQKAIEAAADIYGKKFI